jgi:hypothetical protein
MNSRNFAGRAFSEVPGCPLFGTPTPITLCRTCPFGR